MQPAAVIWNPLLQAQAELPAADPAFAGQAVQLVDLASEYVSTGHASHPYSVGKPATMLLTTSFDPAEQVGVEHCSSPPALTNPSGAHC